MVFWSLDRFRREGVLATLQQLHRLTNQGIGWWSFKEAYLRSVGIFRDAVLSILATIARRERVRMAAPESLRMKMMMNSALMKVIRCTIDGAQEAILEILAFYIGTLQHIFREGLRYPTIR